MVMHAWRMTQRFAPLLLAKPLRRCIDVPLRGNSADRLHWRNLVFRAEERYGILAIAA
jgi:hypothetical protein